MVNLLYIRQYGHFLIYQAHEQNIALIEGDGGVTGLIQIIQVLCNIG